jgi:hypothetical protein
MNGDILTLAGASSSERLGRSVASTILHTTAGQGIGLQSQGIAGNKATETGGTLSLLETLQGKAPHQPLSRYVSQ